MPLSEEYLKIVAFVIGDARNPRSGTIERGPVGTAFFLSVPSDRHEGVSHLHAVTAAHLVMGSDTTALRLRRRNGTVVGDFVVPEWTITEDDLAITLMTHMPSGTHFHAFPADGTPPEKHTPLLLGSQVYYIGLLDGMPHMAEHNIPVVRAGTIAAWNQPNVPIKNDRRVTAHLIDCRSFGGFSGAPCFAQFTSNVLSYEGGFSYITPQYETHWIGMLTGHYDDEYLERAKGMPVIKINIGVGIVMPAEQIRTALYSEEMVEMRRERDEQIPDTKKEREATLDSTENAAISLDGIEFEDALKALLNTPPVEG